MIKLNEYLPILEIILNSPSDTIGVIPKDMYDEFFNFLITQERYEDIRKLELVKDKIVDKTLDELVDNQSNENLF